MDLITISQREITPGQMVDTVNARDLWKFLEVGKDFSTWLKVQINRAKLVDGLHFTTKRTAPPQGGPEYLEYFLTVEAAKQVALLSETDRGFQVRDYFIECERIAKSKTASIDPMQVFEDPAQMRAILLNYCDRVIHLETVVKEQAPLVSAANTLLVSSEGSLCITDAAKQLQVQPKFMFAYLQGHDWIYKRQGGRTWIAYQTRLKQGLLEHKIEMVQKRNLLGIDEDKIVEQVRVTAKGLAKLAALLSSPQSAS